MVFAVGGFLFAVIPSLFAPLPILREGVARLLTGMKGKQHEID